jgi:flagellar motor switch protein FliN/FliY
LSTDTDLAVLSPAAAEAAALLATSLGLDARIGEGLDLWGPDGGALASVLSDGATAWQAELIGAAGPCGSVAFVLPAGAEAPGDADIASALADSLPGLSASCGARQVGDVQTVASDVLLDPRPGQRALAVPLVSQGANVGALVIITPASQAAAELPHLDPSPGPQAAHRSIAALGDVEMSVSVELGRTRIAIRDLLAIHNGAVVQLDRAVSHPVDIFVNGTLIARGEVVVVDECFAVRITELLTGD